MELSKLMFVAIVTNLSCQQKFEQVIFRSLYLWTKFGHQDNHNTWIIYNYIIKIPPLYIPRKLTVKQQIEKLD